MTRRANNEGSICRRASDGRWCGSITLFGTGKRKVVYGKTRKEVAGKLRELQRHQDAGLALTTGRQLDLRNYLDYWLTNTLPTRV